MKSTWSRRLWPLALVVVVAGLVYLSSWVEISNGDLRPRGGGADVYGIRFRDDVNVLFVLIDTLRADRLGCYGYERETSSTLDYMASTGVRFASHLAQSSWTKCSMASLWTSVNPARSGVTRFDHAIPESAVMPAERFAEAGFRTAGIYRNGWVAQNFGFDQGFEVYERPRPKPVPPEVRRENPHIKLDGTDNDAVDNAIEFLRAHGRERWFLYLHLMDVHQYLYGEESALFGSSYSDVYDNSVHHTDRVLGRLLTHLAETGQLEKTVIVFTSDHGEAFSERGLEGHARHVYRESTEIPLIMAFPVRLNEGVTVNTRSRNIDVWPTLLDLMGLDPVEGTDGRSLVPDIMAAIEGRTPEEPSEPPPPAISHLDRTWGQSGQPSRPAVAVIQDGYRYVYGREPDGRIREQLFDANSDPLERTDVIAEHEERASRMKRLAEAYLDHSDAAPWGEDAISIELNEMELNQLRALGYELP